VTAEEIENEFQVHQRVQHHPNIVEFIDCGRFQNLAFIDMGLCDMDLTKYIHSPDSRAAIFTSNEEQTTEDFKFVQKDSPLVSQARNIWTIMADIADGLQEIHHQGLVHRDLNPRNGI
jgi:serine/threonine protein kinase